MRKIGIIAVLALMALAIAAVPALAAKPGAHEQKKDMITCTTDGTTVTCSGTVSGLGNVSTANTQVTADFACATKRSGHQPPGHLQGDSGPLPVSNGSITFSVTTGPASCPSGLVPTIGDTATVSIFSDTRLLYETTVPIVPA